VCAGSHRFNAIKRKEICLEWSKINDSRVMRSGYARVRGVLAVGSYINNEWWLIKIGHCIEYACSIKSETINLNRRVDLRYA